MDITRAYIKYIKVKHDPYQLNVRFPAVAREGSTDEVR